MALRTYNKRLARSSCRSERSNVMCSTMEEETDTPVDMELGTHRWRSSSSRAPPLCWRRRRLREIEREGRGEMGQRKPEVEDEDTNLRRRCRDPVVELERGGHGLLLRGGMAMQQGEE